MAKINSFTMAELCSIISTCASSGVSELKFGSLHVTFGRPTESTQKDDPAPRTEATVEEQAKIQEEVLLQDELLTRQQQLEFMRIEDPHLAEELMQEEVLANDGSTEDDFEG